MKGDAPALLQALDDRRRALLASLETLDPGTLQARPAPGAWSILEIVEHLVVAEQVILQGLPDPAALVDRPRSLRQRCTYPLVLLVLRLGIPVKVPSRRMLPTGTVPLAELRDRWDATHRWLRAYAEGLPPGGAGRAVFSHPVCGPITLSQALRMDRLHLEIHARQIKERRPA
ncbi:MAG: DinB family protein [Geothrix sp.]|uniref:DinB family protein n=1 Tax=Geothrix sp. TaxID=1962974 RepID=UPI0017B58C3E|nr:DinB family protein [Geothrix sp.]NWJ40629.1 DinB family protein [Geothrix sp.]WIL21362.1 MAG: DinB family protein [Geothrix sp.]